MDEQALKPCPTCGNLRCLCKAWSAHELGTHYVDVEAGAYCHMECVVAELERVTAKHDVALDSAFAAGAEAMREAAALSFYGSDRTFIRALPLPKRPKGE